MKPLKFTSQINGIMVAVMQRKCVACQRYTFNAGLVCRKCLDRGCESLPERMRVSHVAAKLKMFGAYPVFGVVSPQRLLEIVMKCEFKA